ncbi:hypothetical protein [Cohnella cholangitidis]|uniref:Pyridoxamine 5'-phosphate oxidase n=1 Tax=Cohnella cholangitidis TaxID=2598458 RepID=A0A7G5BZ49_9BACL|nr:hypothetical protein [Cohnella cholangitidis]QMV42233.1 hypothetical protein FPL14_14290 [Cohnella cholangitidis]
MKRWPADLARLLDRQVPIFIHVAAAHDEMPPMSCRGYFARTDERSGQVWIGILKSQWARLQPYIQRKSKLAALLTCGLDNESYQVKGTFVERRSCSDEDNATLEDQIKITFRHYPNLVPLVSVHPSDCLCIGIEVQSIYQQTPGKDAGALIYERGV